MTVTGALELEIRELHALFARWFSGESHGSDIGRLEAVLAPRFVLVSPHGRVHRRSAVIEQVVSARGRRPLEIEVDNVTELIPGRVATYEEWQRTPGEPWRGRLSTVVMEDGPEAPNGLLWRWVQETWLPDDYPGPNPQVSDGS